MNNLNIILNSDWLNTKSWESQVIQVEKGNVLIKTIIIGNIYRLPKDNQQHNEEFIEEFSPSSEIFVNNNSEVIFTCNYITFTYWQLMKNIK